MNNEKKLKESAFPPPAVYQGRSFFKEGLRALATRTRGELFVDALVLVFAFLLSRTHALFGVYPFALALVCALRAHTVAAFLGAVAGALTMESAALLYILLYTLAFLLRLLLSALLPRFFESRALFDEHPLYRVLEASLVGALMAAYELALFGIYDYTVLFALGAVLFPPLLTLLYAAFVETDITLSSLVGRGAYQKSDPSRTGANALFLQLGGLALAVSLVLSLRPFALFGLSVARFAVCALTLFISRRFGGVRGASAGLVLGLFEELLFAPAYGLLGLLSGLYGTLGVPLSLVCSVLAAGGYAAYTGGLSGFLSLVPELAVSALLTFPFLRAVKTVSADFFSVREAPEKEAEQPPVGDFAAAYREISALLSVSAEGEREEAPEALCKRVMGNACRKCAFGGACAECEAVLNALKTGNGEGILCQSLEKMQGALASARAARYEKKRQSDALSLEYSLHARLFEEKREARLLSEREDREMSERALAALKTGGINALSVTVLGKRCRRARVTVKDKARVDAAAVAALLSDVLSESLSPVSKERRGGARALYFASEQRYTVSLATASRGKSATELSGDRTASFFGEDGMAYAVLSDGMGSGASAADAAALSAGALSSLISAGAREETALSLVGSLLCASEAERTVALDLLSVDLYSGRVVFHKSGGAASFMKREHSLYRIRARTIPMGALYKAQSEKIELEAREGDLLILLSDGVMGEKDDGGWLKALLLSSPLGDLSLLASRILDAAERESAGADDRTVLLLRLDAAQSARRGA